MCLDLQKHHAISEPNNSNRLFQCLKDVKRRAVFNPATQATKRSLELSSERSATTLSGALVLNASYQPLRVIDWQKAMILWFQGKVEILEFHEVTIHSATQTFYLPSVLRFKRYFKPCFSIAVRFSRQNVFLRDEHTCQYCHKKFPEKSLTLDHVVPICKGGGHHWENVVTACSSCNNKKGALSVEKANLRLLNKPQKPNWLPSRELEWKIQGVPPAWAIYLGHIQTKAQR